MFKVWYDMCGEHAEELFDNIDEAFEAFDKAVEASHHEGDYIEMFDLDNDEIVQWFENGDFDDSVDESNYDPYLGQDIIEREDDIW